MTLKEFYKSINGDYDDMFARLSSDELILHFVRCFPDDNSYDQLMDAVKKSDISAIFEATHKLKGVASNLAFTDLLESVSELSEQLRAQTYTVSDASVQRVSESYHAVLRGIEQL